MTHARAYAWPFALTLALCSACSSDSDQAADRAATDPAGDEAPEGSAEGRAGDDGSLCARAFENAEKVSDSKGAPNPDERRAAVEACERTYAEAPEALKESLECVAGAGSAEELSECPQIERREPAEGQGTLGGPHGPGTSDGPCGAAISNLMEVHVEASDLPRHEIADLLAYQLESEVVDCERALAAHPEKTEAFIECAKEADSEDDLADCPELP